MFVRNWKGYMVYIDKDRFNNDVDFYLYLWKTKYNVRLKKETTNLKDLINYVNGENDFI